MKYFIFKLIGTIIIVGIGFILAFKLSYKPSFNEETYYNVALDESIFDTASKKNIKTSFVLGFKDEEKAKKYLKEKNNITSEIRNFLKNYQKDLKNDNESLYDLKLALLKHLYLKNYQIQYIDFNTNVLIY
jgi:hypothetical protein